MKYVLDTNILIYLLSNKSRNSFIDLLNTKYNLFDLKNSLVLSIVTIAELKSIALQRQWGATKLNLLEKLFEQFIIIDSFGKATVDRYAEIDAFSQGKLDLGTAKHFSARNMGKNDLWIAALASVSKSFLLTTDKDFLHLHNKYLQVKYIQKSEIFAV